MLTFLVCLVVVGGAIVAILMVTMQGAVDQPATQRARRDRRERSSELSERAAGHLVRSGELLTPVGELEPEPATTSAPAPEAAPEPDTTSEPAPEPTSERAPTLTTAAGRTPAPALADERPQEGQVRQAPAAPRPQPTGARTVRARPTAARLSLRRLRGAVLLVLLLVGLGTVLAVTIAGVSALVALGVRAAVGT